MARFGSLRHAWQRLLDPYWTHDLCPLNLCRNLCPKGRGRGSDKPPLSAHQSPSRVSSTFNVRLLGRLLRTDLCRNVGKTVLNLTYGHPPTRVFKKAVFLRSWHQ